MEPDCMDTIDSMVCEAHTVPEDDIDDEDNEVTYTPGLGTMMAAKRAPQCLPRAAQRGAITTEVIEET